MRLTCYTFSNLGCKSGCSFRVNSFQLSKCAPSGLKSLTSAICYGVVGIVSGYVVDEFEHVMVGLNVVGGQCVDHTLSGADIIFSVPDFSWLGINVLDDGLDEALLRCEAGNEVIDICQVWIPRVDVSCQCGFLGCGEWKQLRRLARLRLFRCTVGCRCC